MKSSAKPNSSGAFEWLTQSAFLLAAALVTARMTFLETSPVLAGNTLGETTRQAGPASSVVLDWLCVAPAILIFARRTLDAAYVLRFSWPATLLAAIAALGWCSTLWAADRFAAIVLASHLTAAAALLFAGVQLIRDWGRFRLLASVCTGLALALFAHSILYAKIDLPDLRAFWNQYVCPDHPEVSRPDPGTCPKDGKPLTPNREELLKRRGLQPGTFAAQQFEKKVFSNELRGFSASANTFAATLVLLGVVALSLAAQRLKDDVKDQAGMVAIVALPPIIGWMIWRTESKTAYITPLLSLGIIVTAWRWRHWLAARQKRAFQATAAGTVLAAGAIIGHGIYHGTLFNTSLTFRWNYWVGAGRMIARQLWTGVGLDNFGLHYLAVRLPQAPEEVKDPHNLIVKMLAETGIFGGMLVVAWLSKMAWDLTRPQLPAVASPATRRSAVNPILWIVGGAMTLNIAASLDFAGGGAFVANEALRRAIMLAMLLIGGIGAAARSLKEATLDDRPAPLLAIGIATGLGVFMLHNMVDFAFFEPGPMGLFSLLAGAAMGLRHPSMAGQRKRTAVVAGTLAATVVAWALLAILVVAPVVSAEESAADANTAFLLKRPSETVRLLLRARESAPFNADYAFRAAQVIPPDDPRTKDLLNSAIRSNPMEAQYWLARARRQAALPDRAEHKAEIVSDFERALAINPNEVSLRIEAAELFESLGDKEQAARQYQQALERNDLLRPDEPKRLSVEQRRQIQQKLQSFPGA